MEEYNEEKYIVYCHTNKINNKKYIGQTCRSLETRSGSNGCHYYNSSHFYNAIKKYGWNNFEHEILFENISKESADRIEKILIQTFKTQDSNYGYNIQNGGSENTYEIEDLTGQKIGRLTVIKLDENDKDHKHWLCQCSCGNPELKSISKYSLKNGSTISCGCYRNEKRKQNNQTHNMTNTPLYKIWQRIKHDDIDICESWNDFINFYNWSIKTNYSHGMYLKRKNIHLGYNPDNCTWSKTQMYRSKYYMYNGEMMTITEIAQIININSGTLKNRIKRMGLEKAISQPLRVRKRFYTYNNQTHSIKEWAELYNINENTLESRLNNGKSIEEALNM